MKKLLLFILPLLSYKESNAQVISEVYVTSDTLQVYFRQNKILLEAPFRNNGKRLETFSHRFNSLLNDPMSKVRSILIVSGASPEGSTERNQYLSDHRAKAVYDYLIEKHLADSANIEIESRGIDWKGLAACIRESDLPEKDEILKILLLPEWISKNGRVTDGRKSRLMNLQGGKVWRKLYDLYFADLRGTKVMIAYNIFKLKLDTIKPITTIALDPAEVRLTPVPLPPLPRLEPIRREALEAKKNFYLAIETNLLYDVLAIPNIGAEIGIRKGWTIGGNYQNIWFRNDAWTRWYRFEGFEAEVKYYINKERRPFRGQHIGLFGQMLTWDVTFNGRGYLAERWAYGGGLSYGYALPVGQRFNLDFEIGVGWLGGDMHEYKPEDGHRVWQSYEPFRWIGPTKAGVTLQWLVGRGNRNERRERTT